jgi:hypothetical protein
MAGPADPDLQKLFPATMMGDFDSTFNDGFNPM